VLQLRELAGLVPRKQLLSSTGWLVMLLMQETVAVCVPEEPPGGVHCAHTTHNGTQR
jgi:hypothetical protein